MTKNPPFRFSHSAENAQRVDAVRKDSEEEAFLKLFNEHVAGIEPEYPDATPEFPAVLVVGAPRSGHTVMSQVIGRSFDVGIVNHVVARLWSAPVIGIRLSLAMLGRAPASGLQSRHGLTMSPEDPHEFGYFWYDRLKYSDMRIGAGKAQDPDLVALRDCIAAMSTAYGRPLLFKNLMAGLMAGDLARHVPLRVVRMRRDVVDSAISTLRCRRERYGDESAWWSVKTPDFETLQEQPPETQVLQQQLQVNAALDEQLSRPGVVSLEVDYSSFTNDPGHTLGRLREFLSPDVGLRADTEPPLLSSVSYFGSSRYKRMEALLRQM
jgi:hypothetical protein